MNHSNDPILTKHLAAIKHSKYYHYRKTSQETEIKNKEFDKFESFAKEAVPLPPKPKNVGKIRRNSTANNNYTISKPKVAKENVAPQTAIDKWRNDDLITKIRCSQIANQPQKSSFSILNQANLNAPHEGFAAKRNTRSVSSHYEAQYNNMIQEYQKKKEKINHEIQSLRRTEPIKTQKLYETCSTNLNHTIETPKFGSQFSKSQIRVGIKTPLKVNKDPKCLVFLKAIKSQIELQQKLRKLKHQVPNQSKQAIDKLLKSQYGIQENITSIDTDQFDPFAQRKQMKIEVLASELANSYLSASQNWSKNIKNNFQQSILNEVFAALQSGPDKGTISLKGFVRQIGVLLQNQKYLRNRDLYRIYKRIEPFHRQNFMKILKNPNNK